MLKIELLFLFLIVFSSIAVFGQAARKSLPKTISGGIVNSKAINLPKPEYPPAARVVRAAGAVNVLVTINENGDVISAEAASGHPLLRDAAVKAARQAKFSPTKLSGQPVKVTGTIIYNFSLAENYEKEVEILAGSMMLSLLRVSSSDADFERMDQYFQIQEMLNDAATDFKGYAKEFESLKGFKQMTPAKRVEIVNSLASSLKSELKPAETWQFELGEHFGDFFARLMLSIQNEEFLPEKFDQTAVKLSLAKIKDLTYSAPPEFPAPVLAKFKEFAAFADKEQLITPENMESLLMKFIAIVETISPDTDK